MTFATESTNSASERFMLVRIQPRKFMGVGTSIGGNDYTFALSDDILLETIHVNGEIEIDGTHLNGVLTVNSATDLSNAANIVTIDHNIFVTGTTTRITSSVFGLPDGEWKPLIAEYPQFAQSMRNIAEGTFSLSNTTIDLISVDRWGQSLLGENDSLSKAPVSVWVCIDTLETHRKIFDGEVSQVSYSYGKLTLNISDTFSKLKDSASFGTYEDTHIYRNSSLATYPDAEDEGSAAKIVIGKSSPFSLGYGQHPAPIGNPYSKHYHVTGGIKLVKHDYDSYNSGNTVNFFVARFIGTALKKMYFGTVTRCYREYSYNVNNTLGLAVYVKVYHVQCSNFLNGEIGDCLPSGLPGVDASKMYITNNQNYTGPDGQTYQFSCVTQEFLFVTSARSASSLQANPTLVDNSYESYSVYRKNVNAINFIGDVGVTASSHDVFYYIHKFNGYVVPNVVSLGTYNGMNLSALYITINFGSPGLTDLFNIQEVNHQNLYCRFSSNESVTHGEALQLIVESSGMSVNSTTFDDADTALSANVSMTLPANDATQFGSYLDAAQSITSSTLGILRVNEDREVEYELLDNPTGLTTDGTRDTVNMLSGETSSNIEYQDIYSSIEFSNPQLKNVDAIKGTGPNAVIESAKVKQLHRVDRTKTVEHVLESIQDRKEAIAGYFGAPTVEYSLSTSSEDLASSIGDVIEITNTAVADETEVVKGIITALDQRGAKTNVRINEIRGVP